MALFDYTCKKCQTTVELFTHRRDDPVPLCEKCNTRLIREFPLVASRIAKWGSTAKLHKD